TEIEAVIGKYSGNGGIAVNKVVVVARRGFSDAAKKRAKEARIELLTIREAEQSDWSKLAPQQLCLRMQPHIDRVDIVPPVSPTSSGGDPLVEGRIVTKCHGKNTGSPSQWANWLLKTQVLPNSELLHLLDEEAKRRGGQVLASIPIPFSNHDFLYEGRPHQIDQLVFAVHYVNAVGAGKWSTLQVEGPDISPQSVDHLDVKVGGKRIRTVFPEGPTSKQIVLRVDSAPSGVGEGPEVFEPTTIEVKTLPAEKCPLHIDQPSPTNRPNVSPMGQDQPFSSLHPRLPIQPLSSSKKKVGRNSPCPCGSGKKFKHCCLPRK
ncbi:MAG: SEC-C metal-binding domain-containing protein, partial [Thaumarchaeota archaeon]|nr:SEC-C metal-binding domain-containing protein [Nitrososphaerota archaeon]